MVREFSSKGGPLTNTPAFSRAANEMLNPDMIRVLGPNGIQNKLIQAYNDMRVGRYGCIILQLDDIGQYDYNSFNTKPRIGSRLINFFSVTERHATPNFNPTTGDVIDWQLQLSNGTYTLHPDRVIHLSKSGEFYHTPDFQYAWSDLVALLNLSVASAFSSASATFKTIISMDKLPASDTKSALFPSANSSSVLSADKIKAAGRNFAEGVSPVLTVFGNDAKAESVPPQTLDITSPQNPHIENLAAFSDVPIAVFIGHIQAQLAGDKDSQINNELAAVLRERITESLLAPFFNRLILLGTLPTPRAANGESVYNIEWVEPVKKTESGQESESVGDNQDNNGRMEDEQQIN